MNILIMKPKENKFSVFVTVDPYFVGGREEIITTDIVKETLLEKQVNFGACLQEADVCNTNPKKKMGEWIFVVPT